MDNEQQQQQQQQQQQPFHRRWSFRLPGTGGGSSDKQHIQSSATGKHNVQEPLVNIIFFHTNIL